MPQLAMVASWMESLKLPMRKIRELYTKSELAIVGWRSSEMGYNMASRRNKPHHEPVLNGNGLSFEPAGRIHGPEIQALEERLAPLAYKFVDSKGEVDLRKLTGQEALGYLSAMGVNMGRA